ncbi:hypothetical protein B0O80DRAFT_435996 [Mortierella sp. GBAus27b]|nr:hypothetical protein B0O80DRAFT_435996 [Mortierella sp. GBAus27b]
MNGLNLLGTKVGTLLVLLFATEVLMVVDARGVMVTDEETCPGARAGRLGVAAPEELVLPICCRCGTVNLGNGAADAGISTPGVWRRDVSTFQGSLSWPSNRCLSA